MIRKSRLTNKSLDGGSFADIAFMLLFFFLVTTHMDEDKGVKSQLPPPQAVSQNSGSKIVEILVNSQDKVMLEHKLIQMPNLHHELNLILKNNGHENTAFVLKNDEATSYAAYLKVYSALKSAYKTHRNRYSLEKYGKAYELTLPQEKNEIDRSIPIRIAESDL